MTKYAISLLLILTAGWLAISSVRSPDHALADDPPPVGRPAKAAAPSPFRRADIGPGLPLTSTRLHSMGTKEWEQFFAERAAAGKALAPGVRGELLALSQELESAPPSEAPLFLAVMSSLLAQDGAPAAGPDPPSGFPGEEDQFPD